MNNIYIYLFNRMDIVNEAGERFISGNIHLMPPSRRDKCNKYRRLIDKQLCIISYLLLRQGLREIYNININSENEFGFNEYKKPFLKDYPFAHFNISHCGSGAACAVSDAEVGLDIQDMATFEGLNIDVAETICTPFELAELSILPEINNSKSRRQYLLELWTKKESYAKLKGISVFDILKEDLSDNCGFTNYKDNKFNLSCAFELYRVY